MMVCMSASDRADMRTPLRDARLARGWTVRHAATLSNVDPSHLSRAERGVDGLSVDALARLAELYGLTDLVLQG